MSSRESGAGERGSGQGGQLTAVIPIDRSSIESLSWELGTRLTGSSGGCCLLELTNQRTKSGLAVFEATDYTYIVRFQTPVGREKFFGVAAVDLRPMLSNLLDRGDWSIDYGRVDAV